MKENQRSDFPDLDAKKLAADLVAEFGSYRKAGKVFGVSGSAVYIWTKRGFPQKRLTELRLRKEIAVLNGQIADLKKRLAFFESVSI